MGRKTKYNNLTSPELISQINPENKSLILDFMDYLKSVGRSPGTRNGYASDLNIFFVWVLNNLDNKLFTKISKREFSRFQTWLVENNENSPARIRRIKSAISSLSNYIEAILDQEDEFKDFKSTIRKIENPPLKAVREKTVWSEEELQGLLDMLVEKKHYDKACFVALAMFSGRRKAELARFKVSDFDEDKLVCDGALYKSSPILTKGQRYLECYTLAKRFDPYFEMYMKYREENGIESEWLFPDKLDPTQHVPTSVFDSWSRTFSNMTGRYFYPHSLRHYHCSALIQAGIPDNVVVEIYGWKSPQMVQVYDDTPKEQKIAMFFKDGDISVPDKKEFSDL